MPLSLPRLAALVTLVLVAAFAGLSAAGPDQPRLRVGTYDSRAIAVAYAASDFNPVARKVREHEAAVAAGDRDRAGALEAWGERHQRQLHRQGFGGVPVGDLLAHVQDRLPEAARAAGVDVIAFECNYVGPGIETVDVTLPLVRLFDPSPRTLRTVEELSKVAPVDLDEIDRGHED